MKSALRLQRSDYGYHRPRPPYLPVQHVSHTCVINRNTSSEQVIHLPTAVPHLILIGAQKSATSEFRVLADKHINAITPHSVGAGEPSFLNDEVEGPVMELMLKGNKEGENAMIVAMEKTPEYIMHPNLPLVIDTLCPWKPKILTILRDPVERAWSHYRMDVRKSQKRVSMTIPSFAERVRREIDDFISNGLLNVGTMSLQDFQTSLANSNSDVPSSPFAFPKNVTIEKYAQLFEDYKESKEGHLIRGLYAPLLLPWVKQFAADDRLMAFRFAGVADTSIDDERLANKKKKTTTGEGDHHANKGIEMSLDPTIQLYLKFLYQPFNRLLAQLLGEEWDGWGEYGVAEKAAM
eukprot:scaffold571_cov76-Skeletonema_menzelii.AAC.6